MCHHCCIESVKERMLSRRSFFKAAGAATATVAATGLAGSAAAQINVTNGRAVDLTHTLHPDFPTYFGPSGFKMNQLFNFADNGFNVFSWEVNEHTGTHMDAPLHFSADGQSVGEVPVGNLVCPLAVVDIREKAAADADAQVTPDDLKSYTDAHGDIPPGAAVAMLSGWDKKADGDGFRNADSDGKMHFPGFHVEAAQMLMEETGAVGMIVDTLSLDHGPSADFATHYAWLPTNRWGIENAANLEELPASGATLVAGAPRIKGASGGPTRVIALV